MKIRQFHTRHYPFREHHTTTPLFLQFFSYHLVSSTSVRQKIFLHRQKEEYPDPMQQDLQHQSKVNPIHRSNVHD